MGLETDTNKKKRKKTYIYDRVRSCSGIRDKGGGGGVI